MNIIWKRNIAYLVACKFASSGNGKGGKYESVTEGPTYTYFIIAPIPEYSYLSKSRLVMVFGDSWQGCLALGPAST